MNTSKLCSKCSQLIKQRQLIQHLNKQTFSTSSTDYTTLLSNATVHRVLDNDNTNSITGPRKYILLPPGIDTDLDIKEDTLHLAQLSANQHMMYWPKVVQRKLGPAVMVCKPLLEMALDDIATFTNTDGSSTTTAPQAFASLNGLSKWVSNHIDLLEEEENQNNNNNNNNIQTILDKLKRSNDGISYEAVKAIATGIPRPGHSVVGQGTYRDGKEAWMKLSEEYVHMLVSSSSGGISEEEEVDFYAGNGGTFSGIDFLGDTSNEGLMHSGGTLVTFEF